MSVIKNTQRPELTLKKKLNSICYHASRESVAMDESRMAHISMNENPADIASKIVGGGCKRTYLVRKLMHDDKIQASIPPSVAVPLQVTIGK